MAAGKWRTNTSLVGATQTQAGVRDNESAPSKVVYLYGSLEYSSLARVCGPGNVPYRDYVDVVMADFAARAKPVAIS